MDNDYELDPNSDDEIEREENFESSETTATCHLQDVLLCLIPCFQTELSTPASTFTMSTFLALLITVNTNSYSEAINAAAMYAIDNLETFELLGSVLWCRIVLFEQHLADNLETIGIRTLYARHHEYMNCLCLRNILKTWKLLLV